MIVSLPLLHKPIHLSSHYDLINLLSFFRRRKIAPLFYGEYKNLPSNCKMSMVLTGESAVGKRRCISSPEFEVNINGINALFESVMRMSNIQSGLILDRSSFFIRQIR